MKVHTHFASIPFAFAAFLSVLVVGTLWKLVWGRVAAASDEGTLANEAAKMALFQYS
jgi:hypothetical protein